ncbi:precorrin-6Y C5,15-methyltransferase [Agrobacterium rubi TR3 = NBRC 13261]|uniref:Precorrin-6Y C5,15-methyltransferase n=1 Tax=Agrobacterium rubi TR3 = NBRC 13261 TaxID=1368415 RepID=A0A081CXS1_9HYPH|nr:bifunctional cobalt-precorrin-7 (C(5))-methyltransferase/cobalt-precorrin-6B (C(15))-methyltransferase [Agrobacterium rubi]MBP1879599.1 precorrin-6Y C5,15-methyltransferase (decarboxylating) [Agrobacterium rubi]MCL6654312.1 precorrin-6Y methyltransferase [Agrobacterium rubi]GAK71467.1 precorrin-6Y C5,15-methyltransferase [Agrobacterium rubi TR3 = NBRC 13261]
MVSEYAGLSASSTEKTVAPWLSIVGIGEDGLLGLGSAARAAIKNAEFVFGGRRHLALAADAIRGEARPWPAPFDVAMSDVVALRNRNVCVLASGDPFHYGVGVTLLRQVAAEETVSYPAPSAFSLAASRLGWALQDVECVSLHGRSIDLIRPHLHPGAKLIALTSDENAPALLAALVSEAGFGGSRFTLLEALGGPHQRVRNAEARGFAFDTIDPLNVVAIEVAADETSRVLSYAQGLDDALFEHDGQITKREIRAVTLSSLSPRHGELLWDIGAGSGSIGIEWMLAHPSLRAIAIEQHPERAERASRNAETFGVPGLEVVIGTAPDAFEGLPAPDAIFIGGGGSEDGVLDGAIAALKSGGRLVANAVTLEMEAVLLAAQARLGGSLIRLDVARASPVGTMQGWRPSMPVTQWSWVKP